MRTISSYSLAGQGDLARMTPAGIRPIAEILKGGMRAKLPRSCAPVPNGRTIRRKSIISCEDRVAPGAREVLAGGSIR